MKNISFTFCFLAIIILMSCKKYLDAKSNNQLTTPTSLMALQALLDNGQYMNSKSPSFGEASADDYYMPQSKYDTRTPLTQQAYIWNTANLSYYTFSESHDWADLYFVVYNANICLEEIRKIERTSQNAGSWDNIKGSALFLRGRSFLQLAWLYSKAYDSATASQDLGIPLRLVSDFNVPSARSTVKDTYDRIISDLKESVHLLPDLPEQVLRPSKAASYAYLARTYLSVRNYDSAYRYADLSLQLKSDLMDYNDNSVVNASASHPFIQFNKEVVYHQYDNSFSFSSILQKNARIDSNIINAYSSDDLRRSAYFIQSPDGYQFKGSYSGSSLFTGIATDELFLIRAECAARLGNTLSAINDLNTLLVTRWRAGTFIPDSTINVSELVNKILSERRKELVFRDLRWIDIKRLNKEGRNISIKRFVNNETYTLPPNDDRFALPLPTDIINLSGMLQNPQ